jgi:hypothetical protein
VAEVSETCNETVVCKRFITGTDIPAFTVMSFVLLHC